MYEYSKMSLGLILLLLLFFFKKSGISSYPRFLGYLISGYWSLKQCQVWVSSCGVGIKSNQTSVSSSSKFCTTSALAHVADRTDCRSKHGCPGWCPHFSFGSLQSTFPHQRDQKVEVKTPCKHKFDISMSNEE